MDDDTPGVVKLVATATGLASLVWATWCTAIAFVGGTMPILGWESEGGIGNGLLWVFVFDPIILTLAYWASMLVMMPIVAVAIGARIRRESRYRPKH